VLRSMFKTGHALPLVLTRILRPRIGRGEYLKPPRDIDRLWSRTRQIRDQEQSENKTVTRPMRVREQSMSALSPRPQSRSQTGSIREPIAASSVRGQASAVDAHCPRTVHRPGLATSASSPRTGIVREPCPARNCPRRRILGSSWSPSPFQVRIRIIPSYVLI
jgi:hypothetical protein